MVAFVFRMPYGFPGSVNRIESATIQAAPVNVALPPLFFGNPVKLLAADGTVTPIANGDTAALVWGFAARTYPNNTNSWPNAGFNTSTPGAPPTSGPIDILRRGFIMVKINNVTVAQPGGGVFVRVADPAPLTPIGGLEAAADGGDCVVIPGARFTGAQDSNGIAEIEVFIGPIT